MEQRLADTEPTEPFHVRLPVSLLDALKARAREEDRTAAAVIRRMLRAELADTEARAS